MPRPKKIRFVSHEPYCNTFGPLNALPTGEAFLSVEEMEALRLSDVEKLDQDTAAKRMGVSRQTYGRILSVARGIMATALIKGNILHVKGGSFEYRGNHCRQRRRGRHTTATERRCDMPKRDGKGSAGQGQGKGTGRGGKTGGRGGGKGCRKGGKGKGRNQDEE